MRIKVVRIILFILSIVSLVGYFYAPNDYSYQYCYGYFIIFCIEAFLILKYRCKNTLVNFEFFFTVAFAFVNYVYPIVFYQVNPYFSLFGLSFPEDYINKGTALASVAFSFLTIGFFRYPIIEKPTYTGNHGFGDSVNLTKFTNLLLIVMDLSLVGVVLAGGTADNWGLGKEIRGIVDAFLFYTIFQRFYVFRNHRFVNVIKQNKLFFILIFGYILLATLTGNRSIMIRIGSLTLLLYSLLYHQIKKRYLAVLMLGGLSVLFVIGAIRDQGSVSDAVDSSTSVLSVGRDLTINNRSLYVLMDYADKHGVNYGRTFLSHLLSPIPYAQSTLLKIMGWKVRDISSGNLVTDDFFENNVTSQAPYGLGTNLVGDVYLAFGLIGVIVLFYLLGKIVSYFYYKSFLDSPQSLLVYSILFITAIIWTREAYFKPLQLVLWCLAIYYFFDKKTRKVK